MNTQILEECTDRAFQNKITFPETVQKLTEAGIERYCADLVTLQKIYYTPAGEHYTAQLPLKRFPPIAAAFSETGVQSAIKASQRGEIDYPEFLRRIMTAGTVYYDIFIQGRKAIYTGRNGDFHVEKFPRKN